MHIPGNCATVRCQIQYGVKHMVYIFALIIILTVLGVRWISAPEKKPAEPSEKQAPVEEETKMSLNTITLISEAFDRHNIKYRVIENEALSLIEAGFNIQGVPAVRFHFFSQDDDHNDVQMRITGILCKVEKEKRAAMLEACNRINSEMRFLKFYLDKDGDVMGQADLPAAASEDCAGECCFELFVRSMQILDRCYRYFPEAYYSAPASGNSELLKEVLKELQNHPVTLPDDSGQQ